MLAEQFLTRARTHQNNREWDKAIANFDSFLNANDHEVAPSVYASYSICLQETGKLTEAVEIITRGLEQSPKNVELLQRLFAVHGGRHDWQAAAQAAAALITADPENPEHHFRLGKAHAWQGETESAADAYRAGLALTHGKPFEEIITRIVADFPLETSPTKSTYQYVAGAHNLGAIVHTTPSSALLTKISPSRATTQREITFYTDTATHKSDAPIAPKMVHSVEIDGIAYLTIEMLDNLSDPPAFKEVVELANRISHPVNTQIATKHRNAKATAWLLRPTTVIHRFCEIHHASQNEYLLNRAKQLALLQTNPDTASELINELENLIRKNRLHLFIDPDAHYGLVHGDFVASNMGRSPMDGELRAFDWSAFRHGPRVLNAIHYAAIAWVPYSELRSDFLFHPGSQLTTIEQIFALYAYILVQLNRQSEESFDHRMEHFLMPALVDLRTLVATFKQDEFEHLAKELADARATVASHDSLTKQLAKLRSENKKFTQKLGKTSSQLERLKTSTSWRITAPLRALTGAIKKLRPGKRK